MLFTQLPGRGGGAVSHGVIFFLLVLANVTWPALATGIWQSSIALNDLFRLLARCSVLLGIFFVFLSRNPYVSRLRGFLGRALIKML